MAIYIAEEGQSVYDICLNVYNSLDYLVKLMKDNNISSIDDALYSGQTFVYNDEIGTLDTIKISTHGID